MRRQWRAGYKLSRLPHTVALLALSGSGLRDLSLGEPRLWPAHRGVPAVGRVAASLRPFRRQLWRRRAIVTQVRLCAIAFLYLLLANLVWLNVATDLPGVMRWGPPVLFVLLGLFLGVAQRPSVAETAHLLDRWFALREELGTAVEIDEDNPPSSLEARQVEHAGVSIRQLPSHPWATRPVQRGERKILVLVAGAALALTLLAPQLRQQMATPGETDAGTGQRLHAPALVRQLPAAQSGMLSSTTQPRLPSTVAPVANMPSFAASLQMRTGPSIGATGATAQSGPAPIQPLNAALGAGRGADTKRAPSNNGPGGSPAARGGKTGTGGQGDTGAGASQRTAGGQQGSKANGGAQGPQNGPQSDPGTGESQGQPANNLQPNAPSAQNGSPDQGGNGNGQNQANPFGQDPTANPAHSRSGAQNGAGGRQGAGSRTQPGALKPGKGRPATASGANAAPNGDPSQDMLRHGSSSNLPSRDLQPKAQQGTASTALGHSLYLGGHFVIDSNGQGAQLVRVLPLGAGAGPGLNSPSLAGSSTVQGYVPEDNTSISPDEQAQVRTYFSYGNGS